MEREMHMETINQVKKFIDEKDFEGLRIYIQIRENEIIKYKEDKASDYIESLVNDLI